MLQERPHIWRDIFIFKTIQLKIHLISIHSIIYENLVNRNCEIHISTDNFDLGQQYFPLVITNPHKSTQSQCYLEKEKKTDF